ncbi:MAG: hypothetical protein HY920_09120 [Elusimicrobia bacterium]|nr:hypothetical protein [Elusimicrobiota bacterium]
MIDYLGIFKEFNAKKIKYMVVGGLAVNFYGIPRMTYDIDILLCLNDENVHTFLGLMKKWDFKPKAPVNIMDFADQEKRKDWLTNKNMKAFNFVNPQWGVSEIDIILDSPVSYEEAIISVKGVDLKGIIVPTISIKDLIKMKQISNRQQDISDICHLTRIKNG